MANLFHDLGEHDQIYNSENNNFYEKRWSRESGQADRTSSGQLTIWTRRQHLSIVFSISKEGYNFVHFGRR
jgi:hypothetical protein